MKMTQLKESAPVEQVRKLGPLGVKVVRTVGASNAARAVKPAGKRAVKRAKDMASPPRTGWKIGPISIGNTPVVVEPTGNRKRRAVLTLIGGALIGALLDPASGRARRARLGRGVAKAASTVNKVRPGGNKQPADGVDHGLPTGQNPAADGYAGARTI